MHDADRILAALRRLKPELKARYPIRSLGLFGSRVGGRARAESDVDVLIEFDGTVTLFDLVDIRDRMSEAVGAEVDLVDRVGLRPRIGKAILAEVVPV